MATQSKNKIALFFIDRFKATLLLIGFIIIWGVFSYFSMPREDTPEIIIPFGAVTTVFPGASPLDVEELVTKEIEEEIEGLDNIKEFTSSSRQSVSTIFIEFNADADLDKSIQDLKDAVDKAKPSLPEEAEDPIAIKIAFDDETILRYSVGGDMPEEELQFWVEVLAGELRTVKGVGDVINAGKREIEWQVVIDPNKLEFRNIPFNTVVNAIRGNNVSFPAGNLDIDERLYTVRVDQTYESIEQLQRLPVVSRDNGFIYLEDIAKVEAVLSDPTSKSFLFQNGGEVQPALAVIVEKKTGGNIIKVVQDVQTRVDELYEEGIIPENLTVVVTWDSAEEIRDSLNTLQFSALQTVIIILIILFLVLNIRAALITSFIIPLSFLATFGVLHLQGVTINGMTLFSLVLGLGLLVDTAIVITEGMFEGLRKGLNSHDAALFSLRTFKWSVISGVATTIAAFVPMLLVSGVMGQFLRTIPLTVSWLLGFALFFSLTILPALGSRFFTQHNGGKGRSERHFLEVIRGKRDHFLTFVQNKYRQVMKPIFESKKRTRRVFIASWVLLIITALFPILGILKVGFFPRVDFPLLFINIQAEQGSTFEDTEKLVHKVEEKLVVLPEVENFVTTLGTTMNIGEGGFVPKSGEHYANIAVRLFDEDDRERSSFEIIDDYLRPEMASITEGEVTVVELAGGPPSGAPIEVRITGPELDELDRIAGDLVVFLEEIEGTADVGTDLDPGLSEFVFRLNQEEIAYYGLNAAEVGSYLRTLIFGNTVTSVTLDGEDIDIIVKADDTHAPSIDDIARTNIVTSRGPVSLGTLADISFQSSLDVINHRDRERIVRVRSFVRDGVLPTQIIEQLQEKLVGYDLPDRYQLDFGGEVEDIDQSLRELRNAMLVALFLIFLILVLQFNSFKQTLIILISLPLGMIGVFIGLSIMQITLDFPAFIGIIGLTGIVVNDAIILISQINNNLYEKGNPELALKTDDPLKAIVEAGAVRIQPIFLTTITTVLGLLPITFADPIWRSLGFAIIWGLLFATVLTLVIVPVQYVMWQRKKLGVA